MFRTEKESIDFFKKFMEKVGFTDIKETQTEDIYRYYDVEGTYSNGKKYRFELKDRNYTSTRFGDAIMEEYKYRKFLEEKNEYDCAGLVSFFDDCFTISNVFRPIGFDTKMANKTTSFEDRRIVEKNFVHYNQDKKYNYEDFI